MIFGDICGCHHRSRCHWHLMGTAQRCCSTSSNTQGSPSRELSGLKCHLCHGGETLATASLLLHTYHLVHRVIGVVVFWMGTSNPHRFKKFFIFLFIFVWQCFLWLFFLDWSIVLLFAWALAITPSVFFLLPASSLLLPAWGATSKGNEEGQLLKTLTYCINYLQVPCQSTIFLSRKTAIPKHQSGSIRITWSLLVEKYKFPGPTRDLLTDSQSPGVGPKNLYFY